MPTRLARTIDRPIVRYVWAMVLVAAAFLLRQTIIKIFGVDFPAFLTFYPAVMLAALLGGLWSGLLATLLTAMVAAYWIFPPIGSLAIADKSNLVICAFFVGTGIFMSLVAEQYRQGLKQVALHKEQQARREGDDKLREKEEQFEALANSIPQLCWMANPDGWIFWYNQGWYDYTGTTPEQMQGWAWQSVHHPDTLPKVLEQWKASIATANPFEMVFPLKGKDGEFRLFLTRTVPVKDADGKVVRWFGTNTDIDEQKQIEAELRSSNSRLDLALEVAGMGEWELDLKEHTASRSLRHGQIFGYKALLQTWTYEIFLDHVIPECRAEVQEEFRSSLASGLLDFETQIRRTDGEIRWIWVRGRAVLNDTGEPVRMYGIVMDVTERKRTDESIRKLNRIYAVLSDINQTIVREKDSQTLLETACRIAVDKGQFRMAWVGMFNPDTQTLEPIASSGAVDGYLDFKRINLQDPAQTGGPSARSFLSGQHAVCNDIEQDPRFLPWRDEALRRGFRSSGAFPLGVDGRVIGVFMLYASEPGFFDDEELVLLDEMAMDIAFALEVNRHEGERRKVEQELQWRTAFFEAQVESSLDGIMVVDDHGKVILQNQRVYDLWKIPAGITENNDDAKQVEFVTRATKNPDQFVKRIEYLYSHPDEIGEDEVELLDGTILDRYSSPVRDKAGTYYGRIWIFHDITKQRRLEEQFRHAQKMEAIGQLTGGIAHDFNNLLGVILGNLDLIARRISDDAAAARRVQTAQRAAERGADLTRRLLAFSSNVELKPSPTDLHRCARNMIELSHAVAADLSFTTHFDDSIPPVLVDEAGLENALLNLVVNARDAMPNGGAITISTQLTRLEESYPPVQSGEMKAGRYACVSVSDTGSGMSKETLERVFEPFFTTKPPGKGTGLGLAMVYGFVKQSGGTVRIYSEPGYGTTVTFYLRLADQMSQSAPATPRIPSTKKLTGKVLVVDDELDLLDIAVTYLGEMGYTAYRAEDGASALSIVEQNKDIDLVITDIIMPGGMNGAELAQKLRQLLPQVKIVYSSGFPANTLAERSMPLLDGPLLRKPYQRADFEAAIHMALE